MGNNPSKKSGKERPKSLPSRLELPDNDFSTNTASSVSSILINSQNSYNRNNQQQQQQAQQSALSQLNPNYPTGRKGSPPPGATSNGPEMESPEDGNAADNDVDSNQLTVNSINQLTVSSMISINGKTMDIDDYIHRLLEAGYAPKVSKQLCLKNAEVTAICRAAMDVFLSQPVSVTHYVCFFTSNHSVLCYDFVAVKTCIACVFLFLLTKEISSRLVFDRINSSCQDRRRCK